MEEKFEVESTGSIRLELTGYFNPMILQPSWLLANGLIDEEDHAFLLDEEDENFIVSGDFTGIQLRWAKIEATRDSFEVASESATDTPDRVRELALGVCGLLPHTPVTDASIEHGRYFALPPGRWEQIGERVAPSGALEAGLGPSELESLERQIRTESGSVSVLIESAGFQGFTMYMSITEMVEFAEQPNARSAAEWLVARWDAARERAEQIMGAVIKL